MDIRRRKLILSVCVLTMLLFTPVLVSGSDSLVGKQAPMIAGKKAVGKGLIKLSQMTTEFEYQRDERGKLLKKNGKYIFEIKKNIVVLNFFSKTCIPCIKEIPVYNALAAKYRERPIKFLYVNVDESVDKTDMKRMIAKRRIKVPMMLPNQREVVRKYNVVSLPRIVVIDRDGIIRSVLVGYKKNLDSQLSEIIDGLLNQGQTEAAR